MINYRLNTTSIILATGFIFKMLHNNSSYWVTASAFAGLRRMAQILEMVGVFRSQRAPAPRSVER